MLGYCLESYILKYDGEFLITWHVGTVWIGLSINHPTTTKDFLIWQPLDRMCFEGQGIWWTSKQSFSAVHEEPQSITKSARTLTLAGLQFEATKSSHTVP